MHLASVTESEIRITLEVTVELMNTIEDDDFDPRRLLTEAGFGGAPTASEASIRRLSARLRELAPLIGGLVDAETATAAAGVNAELSGLPIAPSVIDHDGVGFHIHWTPTRAAFDDQVVSDVLMALAQELCDNGTDRFGRCGASDCERLFYDGTRNRSRRFCSDRRCANRTHTADHRARQRQGS